ncbi:hypothetical protein CLFE_019720 [Clostridium felsineum DSM 794]|nr:hypothetical protein CLFE_019720 [Clostridium felsineum DSM 794]
MNKLIFLWDIIKSKFRYALLIFTILTIYINSKVVIVNYFLLILLSIFLIAYNVKSKKNTTLFISISIIIYAFIWLFGSCDNVYYFVILDDIFEIKNVLFKRFLIILHSITYMIVIIPRILFFTKYPVHEKINSITYSIILYLIVLFVFTLVHKFKDERDKIKIINADLIEYSFNEREFLLYEERNRISQELHDSIGHSLMALSMNIKYLKAIKDKADINKELDDIDAVIKESVVTLRSTVYNIKKLDEYCDFKKEINTIIEKFNKLNIVKINFNYDNNIDKSPMEIKNNIIKIIKEGITNSLKHGNSTEINIDLSFINSDIELIIQDNGNGCCEINSSNGLNGIKKRTETLNGEVTFQSSNKKGFTINLKIPGGVSND